MKSSPKGTCPECDGYHGLPAMHLDYVGHAALTDRLLDTDPLWSWEPVGFTPEGLPALDRNGGLWIKLTVCGTTRLGYGNAAESEYKEIGSRQKEVIGDALRNAAMRFGAALELWHKGELHVEEEPKPTEKTGQIVDMELSTEGLPPETVKALREEAMKIMGDFLAIGAKAALGSWTAFKKSADEREVTACWSLLDSKTRSAIKKAGQVTEAA